MSSYFADALTAAKSALFGSGPKETGISEGFEMDIQWDCKNISRLVHCMRFGLGQLASLSIRDRQYHFRTYPKVFTGTEAVTYVLKCDQGLLQLPDGLPKRVAASRLLHSLLLKRVFHHVTNEHGFQDADFFYRFMEDEDHPELNRLLCVSNPCPLPALELSLYLLENMVLAILGTPHLADPSLTLAVLCEHNCLPLKNSLAYYQLIWQTSLLGKLLSLESLDEEDIMCFWLNVHNLMCIHACVETFALTNARKASVADGMEMGLSSTFYESMRYRIQGDFYSIADIEQRCLRNMSPKSSFRGISLGKQRFSSKDPRSLFACRIWDHRVNFALVNGTQSSGRVFFFRKGCLKPTLEECTRDFVRLHVRLVQSGEAITPFLQPKFLVWIPRLFEELGNFETTWPQVTSYLPLAARVEVAASHLLTSNIPYFKFIPISSFFHLDLRHLGEGKRLEKPSEYCPVKCNSNLESDDQDGYSVEEAAASVHSLVALRAALTDAEQESALGLVVRDYLEYFRQEWGNAPCTSSSHPGLTSLAEFLHNLYAVIAVPLLHSNPCSNERTDELFEDKPISRDNEDDVIKLLEEVVVAPLFPELLDWYYRKFDHMDAELLSIKQHLSSKVSLKSLGLRSELCLPSGCYSTAIQALDDMAGYLILSSSSVLANFPSMRSVSDCTPFALVSSLALVLEGITDSIRNFYKEKAPQNLTGDDLVLIMSYAVTQAVPQLEGLVGFTSCLADLLQALSSTRPLFDRCDVAFLLRNQQYVFSLPPPVRNASSSTLSSHFLYASTMSSRTSIAPPLPALSVHIKSCSSGLSCSPRSSSAPVVSILAGPSLSVSLSGSSCSFDSPLLDSSISQTPHDSSTSSKDLSCKPLSPNTQASNLPSKVSSLHLSIIDPSSSDTSSFAVQTEVKDALLPLEDCYAAVSDCVATSTQREMEPDEGLRRSRCSSQGCHQFYEILATRQDGFCLATLTCALRALLQDHGKSKSM